MKFIKKHINIIVWITIALALLLVAIMIKGFFFPSDNKVIYGTRLEGRDKVKITEKKKNEIKDAIKDATKSSTVRVAGRIIYIVAEVNEDMSVDSSKELGNKALESLSEEEKNYYDVQVMLDKTSDQDHFPIIGYKHHTKTAITWTKNR